MKRYGVDSVHSWCLVVASSLVYFTTAGSYLGSAGVLYVALKERRGMTAEEASWPSSVLGAMAVPAGLMVPVLSFYFSIRCLITFGVILVTFGHSACYFSSGLYSLCIFYGVANGMGFYLSNILIPALISKVFHKHRVMAMGISLSGIPLGSFLYPLILQACLNNYGLNGSFLLLGAVCMHGLIGAIVLNEFQTVSLQNADVMVTSERERNGSICKNLSSEQAQNTLNVQSGDCVYKDADSETNSKDQIVSTEISIADITIRNEHKNKSIASRSLGILKCRGFHLSNYSQIMVFFLGFMYSLIIIDYSTRKGIPYEKSVYLVSVYSVGQVLGRALFGWIVDKEYIHKALYLAIVYAVISALCLVMPHFDQYEVIVAITVVVGLLFGNLLPMASVMFTDYLKTEDIVIAMSISRTCVGCTALLRSFIIGGFYDEGGSYDNIFRFLAGLSIIAALIWLAEYFFVTRRPKLQIRIFR